jgi:hypothetical protein
MKFRKFHLEKNLKRCEELTKQIQTAVILLSQTEKGESSSVVMKRIEKIQSDMKKEVEYRLNDTRLDYLLNTNLHIKSYLEQLATSQRKFPLKPLSLILDVLIRVIEETLNVLEQIRKKEATMTINFDVLELSMRRYHIEHSKVEKESVCVCVFEEENQQFSTHS